MRGKRQPEDLGFEHWWQGDGVFLVPQGHHDWAKKMAGIAWSNGAYVEREACAKVAESYEPTCDSCPSGVAIAIQSRGIDGATIEAKLKEKNA